MILVVDDDPMFLQEAATTLSADAGVLLACPAATAIASVHAATARSVVLIVISRS